MRWDVYARSIRKGITLAFLWFMLVAPVALTAQSSAQPPGEPPSQPPSEPPSQPHDHSQMQMDMDMDMSNGWQFMQDGQILGLFNHQGGPRGGDDFKAPNWWMGMMSRPLGSSRLTLNAMFSLDPATVGTRGYRELFQVGEAVDGQPLVDRQHPHDLMMQLAAIWRAPIGSRTGLTIAGGPAGEPALGPIAFMHRASAADNPLAPLGHHTFDSTHIAFGVVSAAVDRGKWTAEGSVFNGREPDQHRWDFDFGRMDSVSGRLWFRPNGSWEMQASTGRIAEPEELHPGNVHRTTASVSWLTQRDVPSGARFGSNFTAVTVAYGANRTEEATRHALLAEATRMRRTGSLFGRIEVLQVEGDALLPHEIGTGAAERIEVHETVPSAKPTVGAFTFGGQRQLLRWRGFEGSVGAMITAYAVPAVLRPTHGSHPLSFQVFVRLRPPAGAMGRMWNMRMTRPMAGVN
jgi:hypothetical protein